MSAHGAVEPCPVRRCLAPACSTACAASRRCSASRSSTATATRSACSCPTGTCKYHPSCSQYAIDALRKHGLVKGSFKAGWRLLRCNPWSHGGVDYA